VISLDALNRMNAGDFARALGAIFEHSPWVAERTYRAQPFGSRLELIDSMRDTVGAAAAEEQLELIRAHPPLGARGRIRAALTEASAGEQRRAGLDACSAEQWKRLDELNAAYAAKFGMPFILAVRGHDPLSIIENFERRMCNAREIERRSALREVGLIAGYRLAAAVAAPAGTEVLAMRERLALDAGGMSARLLEWMHAADLDVTFGGRGAMLGRRHSGKAAAETLVIGAHYDAYARALRYDSQDALLMGIALVQQLQEKSVRLPCDLCVIVPGDGENRGSANAADLESPTACVTLAQVAGETGDDEGNRCLASLRAAGVEDRSLAIVRRGPAHAGDRSAASPEASMFDGAVRALEQFLVHNHGTLDHSLALHG
jgi:OHCU decarboxylase